MIVTSRRKVHLLISVFAGLLLCGIAIGGDEDERPPYLIYVDPVTGKYVTEPPTTEIARPVFVDERENSSNSPSYVPQLAVISLLLIALFFAVRKVRMRNHDV